MHLALTIRYISRRVRGLHNAPRQRLESADFDRLIRQYPDVISSAAQGQKYRSSQMMTTEPVFDIRNFAGITVIAWLHNGEICG